MVNLLGGGKSKLGWVCVDAEPGGRVEARMAGLVERVRQRAFEPAGSAFRVLESELEELAASPSRVAALALLESIDGLRRARIGRGSSGEGERALEGAGLGRAFARGGALGRGEEEEADRAAPLAGGDWVCHRLGRSLATGEAEVASRGYFDVEDRPPIGAWVALIVPATGGATEAGGDDALAIAAWVEAKEVERARAGCRACPNGAVVWLSELAPEIFARMRAIEARVSQR